MIKVSARLVQMALFISAMLFFYFYLLRRNADVFPKLSTSSNIFFVETNDKLTQVHPRILCAIESAALYNSMSQVTLVLSTESGIEGQVPEWLSETYSNILFEKLNVTKVMESTPLFELWSKGSVQSSKYYLNNISNLLRLALLYVYGGVYVDSDVIMLRKIPDTPENFLIAQSSNAVNNAVLKFNSHHPFLNYAMNSILKDFKGNAWGYQGPKLMSRLVRELCHLNETVNYSNTKECSDFNILPSQHAYGVPYTKWKLFYEENTLEKIQGRTKESFAIHYWNHMRTASGKKIEMKEDQNLYQLFKQHCPLTEKNALRLYRGQVY